MQSLLKGLPVTSKASFVVRLGDPSATAQLCKLLFRCVPGLSHGLPAGACMLTVFKTVCLEHFCLIYSQHLLHACAEALNALSSWLHRRQVSACLCKISAPYVEDPK